MSAISPVTPVKSFVAILFSDANALNKAIAQLETVFSSIDYRSTPINFEHTNYYQAEMGSDLKRLLLGFTQLISPEQLIQFKHSCTAIEQGLAQNDNKRRVNIDPGYLDLFKVVLASYKARGNKIYLGDGVWADPTLYYQGGRFHAFSWSFPDFKSGSYTQDLLHLRDLYKQALKTPSPSIPKPKPKGRRPSLPLTKGEI